MVGTYSIEIKDTKDKTYLLCEEDSTEVFNVCYIRRSRRLQL